MKGRPHAMDIVDRRRFNTRIVGLGHLELQRCMIMLLFQDLWFTGLVVWIFYPNTSLLLVIHVAFPPMSADVKASICQFQLMR